MTDVDESSDTAAYSKLIFGNTLYKYLKFIALIGLPAFGTLYFALSGVWEWPNPEKVVGTIMAVDMFLGLVLGVSTKAYNASDQKYAGSIVIQPNEIEETTDLGFIVDPNKIAPGSDVVLKVLPPS